MKKILSLAFIACTAVTIQAQQAVTDSIRTITVRDTTAYTFKPKQLIIPGALIAYGFIGINSEWGGDINDEVKEHADNIDTHSTIDDFSRYVPIVAVYGLNLAGIKGKSSLRDRSIILATSLVITNIAVFGLKHTVKEERPDETSNDSFPSGHTATAFAGAEYLYQEYKDVSVWYGVGGYVIAAGTGIFRILNNRHWLTDVTAGAGIGILGTKAAYWLNPWMTRVLFGDKAKEKKMSALFMPFYNGSQFGVAGAIQF